VGEPKKKFEGGTLTKILYLFNISGLGIFYIKSFLKIKNQIKALR